MSSRVNCTFIVSRNSLLIKVHESYDLLHVGELIGDRLIHASEPLQCRARVHELILLNFNLDFVHLQVDFPQVFLQLFL